MKQGTSATPTPTPLVRNRKAFRCRLFLKEVGAGQKDAVNGDGVLTPDNDTLDAWLTARTPLRIFVVLQEGRSGVVTPSAGVVQERLWADTHDVSDSKILVSWEADRSRLVLEGSSTASRGDFQKVLGALQLQTVHFAQASTRKILVQPDVPDTVVRAAHYVRDVKVGASPPNPLLEVDFDKSRMDSGRRLVLEEEHILVYDPDTTDASQVFFRVSGLTGASYKGVLRAPQAVGRTYLLMARMRTWSSRLRTSRLGR